MLKFTDYRGKECQLINIAKANSNLPIIWLINIANPFPSDMETFFIIFAFVGYVVLLDSASAANHAASRNDNHDPSEWLITSHPNW